MELQGTIIKIGETETFGSNGFRKREVVIKTDEQYAQTISVEFVQDRCDVLNSYQLGDNVEISINIRGREWTNPDGEVKYFNSIQGWRIKKTGLETPATPERPANGAGTGAKADDDLPF